MDTQANVLDPYRLEMVRKAFAWEQAGKPQSLLLPDDWTRMIAVYWRSNHKDDLSQMVKEYIEAGKQLVDMPAWDAVLRQKDNCSKCGELNRLENLSLCVLCSGSYCYCCNSTNCHRCGGELVG